MHGPNRTRSVSSQSRVNNHDGVELRGSRGGRVERVARTVGKGQHLRRQAAATMRVRLGGWQGNAGRHLECSATAPSLLLSHSSLLTLPPPHPVVSEQDAALEGRRRGGDGVEQHACAVAVGGVHHASRDLGTPRQAEASAGKSNQVPWLSDQRHACHK